MRKIVAILNQYRLSLIWVLVLILFGLILVKLPALTSPPIDQDYLRLQRQSQITNISVKDTLREQLERLVDTPVDTQPHQVGQTDPFNP
ncbi:hypothetical protein HY346_00050 [Candidatus Microgenomates bacterium]|nr:hypothetical protein [Candidatus Microgenomates bacterium]